MLAFNFQSKKMRKKGREEIKNFEYITTIIETQSCNYKDKIMNKGARTIAILVWCTCTCVVHRMSVVFTSYNNSFVFVHVP